MLLKLWGNDACRKTCHVVETELPGMPGWVPVFGSGLPGAYRRGALDPRTGARIGPSCLHDSASSPADGGAFVTICFVDGRAPPPGPRDGSCRPRNIMAKDSGNMSETNGDKGRNARRGDHRTRSAACTAANERGPVPALLWRVTWRTQWWYAIRSTAERCAPRSSERAVAEAMALKGLACPARTRGTDQPLPYHGDGRAALKAFSPKRPRRKSGRRTRCDPFGDQHRDLEEREVGTGPKNRTRYNLAESPLQSLATAEGPLRRPIPLHRDGRRGRTASGGLRTRSDGAADHPELGAVPVIRRRRPARRWCARPAGRRPRETGCSVRFPISAPGFRTLHSGPAAFSRAWKPSNGAWVGRHDPARSCSGSRSSA